MRILYKWYNQIPFPFMGLDGQYSAAHDTILATQLASLVTLDILVASYSTASRVYRQFAALEFIWILYLASY